MTMGEEKKIEVEGVDGVDTPPRARVTPEATMCASVTTGAPARSAVRAAPTRAGWTSRSSVRSVWPVPCTIRTATASASAGRWSSRASARIVAKDSR